MTTLGIAQATGTAVKFYRCTGSACTGFYSQTIISRSSPSNLSPRDNSVRLALAGEVPTVIAMWDDALYAATCPAGITSCTAYNYRWGVVKLADMATSSEWQAGIAADATRRYVVYANLDYVRVATCESDCNNRDRWYVNNAYGSTSLMEPTDNNPVFSLDKSNSRLVFVPTTSDGSTCTPRVLFDGVLNPPD